MLILENLLKVQIGGVKCIFTSPSRPAPLLQYVDKLYCTCVRMYIYWAFNIYLLDNIYNTSSTQTHLTCRLFRQHPNTEGIFTFATPLILEVILLLGYTGDIKYAKLVTPHMLGLFYTLATPQNI
jgi:hypothetical protein